MIEDWNLLITMHAVSASFALLFGAFQLLRRRTGDLLHRITGRIWVLSMLLVCGTSFGIRTLNGGFSWLHALSVLTIITVTIGVAAAVQGKIKSHKAFMRGSYFGLLGAFGGVIAVPSRRIPELAMYDLPTLVMWVASIAIIASGIIGIVHWKQLQTENP